MKKALEIAGFSGMIYWCIIISLVVIYSESPIGSNPNVILEFSRNNPWTLIMSTIVWITWMVAEFIYWRKSKTKSA